MTLSFSYLIIIILVGVLMPILGVISGNKTKDMLTRSPELKVGIYRQTIIMLLGLAVIVLSAMYFNQDPIDEIGIGFMLEFKWLSILVISCLLFLACLHLIKLSDSLLRKLASRYHRVMYLMPSNRQQYLWSLVVSFTAGFAEEIIFRGFLFVLVSKYLLVVPSLVLINIIFAFCHWGTGLKNALWSFGLGVIWSITFLVTGSLWLAILCHVSVDLLSMTIGYKALTAEPLSGTESENAKQFFEHNQ